MTDKLTVLDVYRTTFELTAPLRLPLFTNKIVSLSEDDSTGKYTHKLITIAMDTLRLEDPSTLFETHALKNSRREKLRELIRAHIVFAESGTVYQICSKLKVFVYSRTIG